MTTVTVYSEYRIYSLTDVVLPKGKSEKDIKEINIKWGNGQIEFKDETTLDFIEEHDNDHEFLKHPIKLNPGQSRWRINPDFEESK